MRKAMWFGVKNYHIFLGVFPDVWAGSALLISVILVNHICLFNQPKIFDGVSALK